MRRKRLGRPTALSGSFIAPVCANAVQVMDWRMPRDAGQYEIYAEALFGAAADALLAPPMPDEN